MLLVVARRARSFDLYNPHTHTHIDRYIVYCICFNINCEFGISGAICVYITANTLQIYASRINFLRNTARAIKIYQLNTVWLVKSHITVWNTTHHASHRCCPPPTSLLTVRPCSKLLSTIAYCMCAHNGFGCCFVRSRNRCQWCRWRWHVLTFRDFFPRFMCIQW